MKTLTIACLLSLFGLLGSSAANAQNVNVRGTISAFDGKTISVKARDGRDLQVDLPENAPVATTRPFGLADLKPGMVLGVTTVKKADGQLVAIDVHPIPPSAPPGLFPYDLQPGSTMTNAALEASVQSSAGHEITLNYKTGTVKVLVPEGTPMAQTAPGQRADLVPGQTVYIAARPGEGGKLTALRVQVGKDGVNPTQ
jgi:hypothetical protein